MYLVLSRNHIISVFQFLNDSIVKKALNVLVLYEYSRMFFIFYCKSISKKHSISISLISNQVVEFPFIFLHSALKNAKAKKIFIFRRIKFVVIIFITLFHIIHIRHLSGMFRKFSADLKHVKVS